MKRLAVTLALLAAACGGEEAADQEAERPEDVLMHDTLPPAATTPGDTAGAISVVLNEWTIRPARDTIDAGRTTTRFRVRNNGTYGHSLAVDGQGDEWATDTIPPGDWVVLDTRVRSGTYHLYCPIQGDHGDHSDLGMSAYLVVR